MIENGDPEALKERSIIVRHKSAAPSQRSEAQG
jgi:hypothetical protein